MDRTDYDALVELVAEQIHVQWEDWTRDTVLNNGASEETVCRWRQSWIAYSDLPEDKKIKNRTAARKMLDAIGIYPSIE